jgi:hypothetical protein
MREIARSAGLDRSRSRSRPQAGWHFVGADPGRRTSLGPSRSAILHETDDGRARLVDRMSLIRSVRRWFSLDRCQQPGEDPLSERRELSRLASNTFSGASTMAEETVIKNQETIIANQEKILANQGSIESNQAKLDKIVANQESILSNQDTIRENQAKLDKVIANQSTIFTNQETIQGNQDKIFSDLKEIITNQKEILANQAKILAK